MPDLASLLALRFRDALTAAVGQEHAQVDPLIRPSANPKFGDFQANVAMSLAKTLNQKPRDLAIQIVEHLAWQDICDKKPEIAGPGFINLSLKSEFLAAQVSQLSSQPRLGVQPPTDPQTIIVDYSGPNVAKEMHVGHLRSTVIGDALARVLEFQGHRIIRQNHLGDWGTQFGMLIEHMIDEGWTTSSAGSISDLNAMYQAAKKKFDADPAFADRSRKRVVALQGGDAETLALWRALIDESKHHFNAIYRDMGIELTDADIRAESSYNPLLADVVKQLESSGLAQISQGALCVFIPGYLDENKNPLPMIVRKSDGGYLYATTDLTALRYRINDLKAHRIIYVTDARQKQHFAMVFQVARMAQWLPDGKPRLDHVPFGTVLGEDGKPFKTRSGDTVKLADLLEEAQRRALEVVTAKNPELSAEQRATVAQVVGIGAIKYADLANDRIKDYVFDWDRMLSFDGNTAPYLQNAYVRIQSIFRKAQATGVSTATGDIQITDPTERALAMKLLQFPAAVSGVAESLEPHRLCTYLYELASGYHQFYEKCPVLTAAEPGLRSSRLALSRAVAHTLKTGLQLLGIGVVEQM